MRSRDAAAGASGAVAAVTVGELVAMVSDGIPSPLVSVQQQVVVRAPGAAVTWAIDTFGTANRPVLAGGSILVILLAGAAVGLAAGHRSFAAPAAFVAAGSLAAAASWAQPGASPGLVVVGMAAAASGGLLVVRCFTAPPPSSDSEPVGTSPRPHRHASAPAADVSRRVVLAAAAVVIVGVAAGRYAVLVRPRRAADLAVGLPQPVRTVARAMPANAFSGVSGLTPLLTPNDDFYRIDTAIQVPRVDPNTWTLRVHGAVDREQVLTYDELLAMPLVEVPATLVCVSNEVGGDLIGTARWLGVPLADVLDRAGVRSDGEQVVGRAVDGWTAGFPIEAVGDGRPALVAVGMNGEPLPERHGFPARLVVAGLYGYVSATKWLSEIELTSWDGFDAYWVPRGWAKEGPIKTASRIDVPRSGGRHAAGETVIAGVAWAPRRGVARVEVQLDDEPWAPAERAEPLSSDTWIQWRTIMDLPPGEHRLRVRAVDATGALQPEGPRSPAPDGAEGWHSIRVRTG